MGIVGVFHTVHCDPDPSMLANVCVMSPPLCDVSPPLLCDGCGVGKECSPDINKGEGEGWGRRVGCHCAKPSPSNQLNGSLMRLLEHTVLSRASFRNFLRGGAVS